MMNSENPDSITANLEEVFTMKLKERLKEIGRANGFVGTYVVGSAMNTVVPRIASEVCATLDELLIAIERPRGTAVGTYLSLHNCHLLFPGLGGHDLLVALADAKSGQVSVKWIE